MAKKTDLTYEAAMERLETIVQGLIKYCSGKLQQVENDVKKILNNEQK